MDVCNCTVFFFIDYEFFLVGMVGGWGGGVLGNKAVKVKESDCEKMVSANFLF